MEKILFTSESVTEGHPDKVCDSISDAILDAMMAQDPMSRVACETATTTGLVLVMGEITTKANVDIQKIVRDTIREIGYDNADYGFDADTCAVITSLDKQSTDIAMGVDKALEQKEDDMNEDELDSIGAGDQGLQFGYASNETEEYMPYAINMAHKLAQQLTKVRKDGTLKYLRPDGKTQVTVEYDEAGKPKRIDSALLPSEEGSSPFTPWVSPAETFSSTVALSRIKSSTLRSPMDSSTAACPYLSTNAARSFTLYALISSSWILRDFLSSSVIFSASMIPCTIRFCFTLNSAY